MFSKHWLEWIPRNFQRSPLWKHGLKHSHNKCVSFIFISANDEVALSVIWCLAIVSQVTKRLPNFWNFWPNCKGLPWLGLDYTFLPQAQDQPFLQGACPSLSGKWCLGAKVCWGAHCSWVDHCFQGFWVGRAKKYFKVSILKTHQQFILLLQIQLLGYKVLFYFNNHISVSYFPVMRKPSSDRKHLTNSLPLCHNTHVTVAK